MRQQRTQRMSTPTPVSRVGTSLPSNGYALVVDGRAKADFKTHDQALKAALELKGRFPMLQVKVYDAERKQGEMIDPAAAQAG